MKKLLALLLALVMVFALCACGGTDEEKNETKESKTVSDAEETEDTKPATYNYVVTVVNEEGNPVSGVRVKMNASGATTQDDGIAELTSLSDKITVTVDSVPEGYADYTEEHIMDGDNLALTITLKTE